MSIVDFAENCTFEVQNEMQSMHWHSYQKSILVHISFCHNLTPDPYDEDFKILKKYHFIFQMIINTIQSLCNIVLSFIGAIWWSKDMLLNGIGFGN